MPPESPDVGRLLTLAQRGRPDDAVRLAEQGLARCTDPVQRTTLLYARTVAHLFRGDHSAAMESALECIALSDERGDSGWLCNSLALRAYVHANLGHTDAMADDLLRAEGLLADCVDNGLRNWAHAALGTAYLAIRMYELARPHFESAVKIDEQPVDFPWGKLVDLHNLIDLHLRWAAELERVGLTDEAIAQEYEEHLREASRWATEAGSELARPGGDDHALWVSAFARTRAQTAASLDPEAAVPLLRTQYRDDVDGGRAEDAALSAADLSRALRMRGRLDEAMAAAEDAVRLLDPAQDPSTHLVVHHQLHLAHLAQGHEGSLAAQGYLTLSTTTMWEQRARDVAGLRARRDFVLLEREHALSVRLAMEDPLTTLANRRAFDHWLRLHPTGPAAVILVDLDDFKDVNDTAGHVVGDLVLRRFATALRQVAREDDIVARYGGDEFVIALEGPLPDLEALTERVRGVISELDLTAYGIPREVRASVGTACATEGEPTSALVDRADRLMFAAKRRARV